MKSDMPLISVVIPVYKVEKYLNRCMERLCGQTYENIEIILVDDGSPDNSPQLCELWAQKDERVKVIHKENGGPSEARNAGIAISKGEYISFVDSDDYVSLDYLEYLFTLLREHGADISCASFRHVTDGNESFENQPTESVRRFSNTEACHALFGEHYMPLVTAWAKLFKRHIVLQTPFPDGRLHEDDATAYKFLYESKLIVFGTREIYAYFENSNSITHNKTDINSAAIILASEEQYHYFGLHEERELQLIVARRFIGDLVYLAAKGDAVCREYLAAGRGRKFISKDLDAKSKLRYYGYMLLRLDLVECFGAIRSGGAQNRI